MLRERRDLINLTHAVVLLVFAWCFSLFAVAQAAGSLPADSAGAAMGEEYLQQFAHLIGVDGSLATLRTLSEQQPCDPAHLMQELRVHQQLSDKVLATSLDIDGVLAEISNERAELVEVRSVLQSRRDRSVNLLSIAGLVTGTGLGIVTTSMQFNSSTANLGNGLGVGSGIASTVLSVVGIRKQRGPGALVGRMPNMLAPVFGKPTA